MANLDLLSGPRFAQGGHEAWVDATTAFFHIWIDDAGWLLVDFGHEPSVLRTAARNMIHTDKREGRILLPQLRTLFVKLKRLMKPESFQELEWTIVLPGDFSQDGGCVGFEQARDSLTLPQPGCIEMIIAVALALEADITRLVFLFQQHKLSVIVFGEVGAGPAEKAVFDGHLGGDSILDEKNTALSE